MTVQRSDLQVEPPTGRSRWPPFKTRPPPANSASCPGGSRRMPIRKGIDFITLGTLNTQAAVLTGVFICVSRTRDPVVNRF